MRYYDDEDVQHYAPLLRRVIILMAIITAVPVMLWTATAFMRAYVAQPTIPSARPIAAASTAPGDGEATQPSHSLAASDSNAAPTAPRPAVVEARATTTDLGSATTIDSNSEPKRSDAGMPATDPTAVASISAPKFATSDAHDAAATAADDARNANSLLTAQSRSSSLVTSAALAATPAAPPSAPRLVPSTPSQPSASGLPAPTTTMAMTNAMPDPAAAASATPPQAQMASPPISPVAAAATATDALPPPDPISGPVPLPPHRPRIFALVETGVVPLPRARPVIDPEPAPVPANGSQYYGYDPGLSHY